MSNDKTVTNKALLITAVAFLFGGLLGWGLSVSLADENGVGSALPIVGIGGAPESSPVNKDLQLPLNNLLVEHGNLATLHLQALFDGKDIQPTANMLDTNTQNLANYFSGVYGTQVGDAFIPMWKEHIAQYEAYTMALKNNDRAGMDMAKQKLTESAEKMGMDFHNWDNEIDAGQVTNLMNEHVRGTLNIIEFYSQGDQQNTIIQIKQANDQASRFAAYLSGELSQYSPSPRM